MTKQATSVKTSNGYDRCSVRVKFPTGGVFNINFSRSGESITLGGSDDPVVAKQQLKAVQTLLNPVTADETVGQKMARIAAFVADCTSVSALVAKINL